VLLQSDRIAYQDYADSMNWLNIIHSVLGKFWTWLFADRDFILGVQKVHALIGSQEQANLRNNLVVNDIESKNPLLNYIPTPLYIDNSTIGKAFYTLEEILDGDGTFDARKETSSEWSAMVTDKVGSPYMLTDHVTDYTTALFRGIDFECRENELIFRIDPKTLGLRTVKETDSEGNLHVYSVIWAWHREDVAEKDAVRGLITPGAADCASMLWRIRHEGATLYNAQAALAKVSGSVVSDVKGTVEDIWTEQDYRHMLISGHVYSAPVTVAVRKTLGDDVDVGDVLFGDMLFFSRNDVVASAQVPGIRVTTDVGSLVAPNEDDLQVSDNVLPLSGDSRTLEAYNEEMRKRNTDLNCPQCVLPVKVNPLKYITQEVRRGRSCIAVLSADKTRDVNPALKAIRDNISASAILDVVIKTTAEATFDALTLKSATDVGNGAVAVSVTPLEAEDSVSVEVWR